MIDNRSAALRLSHGSSGASAGTAAAATAAAHPPAAMLLTADDFAAGAQQLAAAWQAHLPGEPPWQWVPSQAPFAASTVSPALGFA